MSGEDILVVNAGSTSLKLHLVDRQERSTPLDADRLRTDVRAGLRSDARGGARPGARASVRAGLRVGVGVGVGVREQPRAVAHRVVHGGARLRDPVLIDAHVIEQIFALEALAPLHNAPALRGIELAKAALPDVPHVAVFDSGFHRTMPEHASTYALPRRFGDEWDVRRYGFHGLSVQWSAQRAAQMLGERGPRLVVCHLGGGCSVSAVRDGRSLDTSMGFSPLEGVPMATRSGSIDPGALLYLLRERKLSLHALEHVLNFESGLRALGGDGGDMAQLQRSAEAHDRRAQRAIDVFAYRVAGAAASMAMAAGGIDALVFTGGIGEGSSLARERICERLELLGVRIDAERNRDAQPDRAISAEGSDVAVLVIHAREELVAARAARALLSKRRSPAGTGARRQSLAEADAPPRSVQPMGRADSEKRIDPPGGAGRSRGRE